MKKLAIVIGVLAVLAGVMCYNIWTASQTLVTSTPGPFELGQQKLHSQLEETKRTESETEKQYWDSAPQLRELIKWHQQRIEKLAGNSQSGEIVAYDRDSMTRLEKRIADLAAQESAKRVEQAEEKQAVQ